jgi:hypothetical protein
MANNQDSRESARSNVFLAAVLASAIGSVPVRIRNISVHGALIDGASLPQEGTRVELHRGRLSAAGEIAWRSAYQCGLRFENHIVIREWVERVGHAGQEQVDRAIAALRRTDSDGFTVLGSLESTTPPADLAKIAEELQSICERLAASPSLSVELGEELLKLEALAHTIRDLDR